MGLNIKNERTHELIRELATLKGVSQVEAVTQAVEEDLRRQKARQYQGGKGLAEWLMDISRETSALIKDQRSSKEIMDELYDEETGLPK